MRAEQRKNNIFLHLYIRIIEFAGGIPLSPKGFCAKHEKVAVL